jgi:NADH:ubiquinone oxidoreductase subunit F (NADH-binding)/(2Fe-2S) ferredoxin
MNKLNNLQEFKSKIQECKNNVNVAKRVLTFCCSSGCVANKSLDIKNSFDSLISKNNLDSKIQTKRVGCFGFCSQGPFVKIYPDNVTYKLVKESDVQEIFESHLLNNNIVERLVFKNNEGKVETNYNNLEFFQKQKRIALHGCGEIDPNKIEDAFKLDGYTAFVRCLEHLTPLQVIEEVKNSGLRGRGGGGFPTGRKWEAAYNQQETIKYVICNGDEGDPGAFMDRSILESNPHAVVEGMLIAGYAIGATKGFIYVRAEYPLAVESFSKAVESAREYGILGNNILGTDFNFDIEVRLGAGAFVCGEETALIGSIEGKRGMPSAKPPYPAQKGLWGKPTIINNVETFANLPFILKDGGVELFKTIGTEKSKGTKVFALSGKVKNIGLVEVPMGTTLRELIYDIGGGIANDKEFKAIQTGGPSGGCLTKEDLDTPIDFDNLLAKGSMMGSGGAIVMDEDNCMIDVAKFYLNFICEESCGKCTPCRIGTTRMLEILEKISDGKGEEKDLEELENLANYIKKSSLCGLGQSAPNPVLSTLAKFKDEYLEHIKEHKCRAKVCKGMLGYAIDPEKCKKCGLCARQCPVGAISGVPGKEPFKIDPNKCIKCGLCMNSCAFKAIDKTSGGIK